MVATPKDHIRHVAGRDLQAVVAIAQDCFGRKSGAIAWFKGLMKSDSTVGWVLERDKAVVGYCFVQMFERTLNIIQLAVAQDYQRSLVGETLVRFLKEKVGAGGYSSVVTFVPDDELPMHMFFRWMGFVKVDEAYGNTPEPGQFLFQFPAPAGSWSKARQGVGHHS